MTAQTRAARRTRTLRRIGGAVAAVGVALLVSVAGAGAPPAHAAGQVTVSGTPNPDGESTIEVSGSGFQSVQGGFGGIYVLFGWVDDAGGGSWKPTNGGVTGENYRYVYDDESNPVGYQLFVTFPGSSTSYAANGGEVSADGSWSGTMRIPGITFQTFDRNMNTTTVDCREVQCGVITIGAHGVKNANNESFTPVTFAAASGGGGGAGGGGGGAGDAADETGAATQQTAQPEAAGAAGAADNEQDTAPVATSAPVTTSTQPVATSAVPDWFLVLLPVILIAGLSILALAVGVGAYLAAKSLLLGVNPEALEKVRGQRERRAIREREKQRRKSAALRHALETRSAKARQRVEGNAARAALPASPMPRVTASTLDDDAMTEFFRSPLSPTSASTLDSTPTMHAFGAPTGADRESPAADDPEAPTLVLYAASAKEDATS